MCFLNLLPHWYILQVHNTSFQNNPDSELINSCLLSYLCHNPLFRRCRRHFPTRKEKSTWTMWIDIQHPLPNWLQDQTITNNRVYWNSIKGISLIMGSSKARHFRENGANIRKCIFQSSIRRESRSTAQKYKDIQ